MAYLLDTNVFIQAKNLYYGFDFCPAFWEWLLAENRTGRVFSIDKVNDELQARADDLADWAKERGDGFFLPPDPSILPSLTAVSAWVNTQRYDRSAISTFVQVADYYLVARALSDSHTVVTHEIPSQSVRIIKIPNVCIGLGVRPITPFEMLRRERALFVLGTRSSVSDLT